MPPKKPRRHPWRENLETLTGAVVLALIFKAFLLEISRIPSPSMEPTLMGSPELGLSDRVLVDKLSFSFRDPKRWEIVVFKHPLERSRNMVKRVVGLPGEELKILDGDLWVRGSGEPEWRIPRRPRAVQREMWKDVDLDEPRLSSWRAREGESGWRIEGRSVQARGAGAVRFRPDQATVVNGYADGRPDSVRARMAQNVGGVPVGDLRVSGRVRALPGTTLLAPALVEGELLYRFAIPGPAAGEGATPTVEVWREAEFRSGAGAPLARAAAPPYRLPAGAQVRFAAQNLDDRLTLEVDGEWVAELDVEPVSGGRSRVELALEGEGADLDDLRVQRDVHYLQGQTQGIPVSIPPGRYYMMGDNTQGSADSREWTSVTYLADGGAEVRGNFRGNGENPSLGTDREGREAVFLRDEWGERHRLPADATPLDRSAVPTVPRELIQGRALAIFWPIRPSAGIWRVGWLH